MFYCFCLTCNIYHFSKQGKLLDQERLTYYREIIRSILSIPPPLLEGIRSFAVDYCISKVQQEYMSRKDVKNILATTSLTQTKIVYKTETYISMDM